ncbi:hypothetical protein K9N50_01415 [bacterium]|nr:hypothetical protein [bacterium]
MRLILQTFLVFLLFISSIAGAVRIKPQFQYDYIGADQEYIDKLDIELKQKLKYIESNLETELKGSVKVILTLSEDDFARKTRGGVPGWAGGIAYPQQQTVVLKTPLFFGQGVPVEVLAAHEVTHVLIHQIIGDNYLPRWLEEGLCQVLAGESRTGSFGAMGRAAAANRLMGLPRVDHVLGFSRPDANLAYTESRYATAALVDRFGWRAINDLLSRIGDGTEFEEAFFLAIGVDYEFWQVEWLEDARTKYSVMALLEMQNLIWIIILLLAILAMIVTFVRRKLQLRRWTEEEEDEDDYNEPIFPE